MPGTGVRTGRECAKSVTSSVRCSGGAITVVGLVGVRNRSFVGGMPPGCSSGTQGTSPQGPGGMPWPGGSCSCPRLRVDDARARPWLAVSGRRPTEARVELVAPLALRVGVAVVAHRQAERAQLAGEVERLLGAEPVAVERAGREEEAHAVGSQRRRLAAGELRRVVGGEELPRRAFERAVASGRK